MKVEVYAMSEQDIMHENEFAADLMTLVDDEGIEHQFEIADTMEFEGEEYVALIPIFEDAAESLDDAAELVILRSVTDNGEEFLEAIEDEELFNKIGEMFVERLQEEYDFEDEE